MLIRGWSSDVCSSDLAATLRESTIPAATRTGVDVCLFAIGSHDHVSSSSVRFADPLGLVATVHLTQSPIWTSSRARPAARLLGGRGAIFVRFKRDLVERAVRRSEEHTSEPQSLMRIPYAVFCLKKKNLYIPHQY